MSSITLKTVTASPMVAFGDTLTPRLHLTVSYTKGGKSGITGQNVPRGYQIAIQHDRVGSDDSRYIAADRRSNPQAFIELAERYDKRKLDKIADDIRSGRHDRLIAELYATATDLWKENDFPGSILPLVAGYMEHKPMLAT